MKIAASVVAFLILAAIFSPSPSDADKPVIPSIGEYWVVNPHVCGLSWETQIWFSRAFEEIRVRTGRTTVVVCVEGVFDNPEQEVSVWAKNEIDSVPYQVWLVMPEETVGDRLVVVGTGQVPDHSNLQELVSLGKFRSLLEEIMLVSEGGE